LIMKKIMVVITAAAVASGLAGQPVLAQNYGRDQYQPPDQYQNQNQQNQYQNQNQQTQFDSGYRTGYRAGYDAARNRSRYNDRAPQFNSGGNSYQGNNSGGGNRDQQWRQEYSRSYTYNDDAYYQQCRTSADPAGIIAGALIGGLLGNSVSRGSGRGGATAAGVIIGGALGAGLTSHLNCQDRSYAYKTYYDGFNSGRAHSDWQWDNPNSGDYGDFRVGDYYNDRAGFRCASFDQQIYVNGRPEVGNGHACQQPDGTWAIVS
jgi:surface antigen/uncharacterized protein YxeA